MDLSRRALALLALAPAAAAAQLAPPFAWRFRVTRNGTDIGTHEVRVTEQGGQRVTHSEVMVVPRVLGVVVYRFEHRYTEVTDGWRFRSVESRLNRNGRIVEVSARATPDGVLVQGPDGPGRLPANAAPLSWWDPSRLGGVVPIFGTTTGQIMDLRWSRRGLPNGGFAVACTGEVEAECLFSRDGVWTGFSTVGDDGSRVIYQPFA
ncbi:DUF6134 family protein [Sabulicella glaciei]|uniref:DUF6134 family protein n=1 Tax=Sabulicella glaciei TaxID=2984948 RepID=A0ABT3NT75_9PROT|nr:DUF6134 family protein [Roseococcus sp. MDT2-1-1]MCW8084759.1 DUF6134 family protein [Roseococcus sp. MDT2-1-1]